MANISKFKPPLLAGSRLCINLDSLTQTSRKPISNILRLLAYRIVRKSAAGMSKNKSVLKEKNLVLAYSEIHANSLLNRHSMVPEVGGAFTMRPVEKNMSGSAKEKRGYIKHMVRLRYRWHFRHELSQFKLFRKFFRRGLKRYRKIQKNRLFVTKFRKNFSKLTGFNEKFIYLKWLHFRKNYNQYWSTSNAVARFGQSLVLVPYCFLVIAKVAPSLAASKHLINSGAVSINGVSTTSFGTFIPGDILQINLTAFQGLRVLFSYQQWNNIGIENNTLPFMYVDWSCMLFMLTRWPRGYEFAAPSFLSERWVRYYVRIFPNRAARFKKMSYNTKTYKQLTTKK